MLFRFHFFAVLATAGAFGGAFSAAWGRAGGAFSETDGRPSDFDSDRLAELRRRATLCWCLSYKKKSNFEVKKTTSNLEHFSYIQWTNKRYQTIPSYAAQSISRKWPDLRVVSQPVVASKPNDGASVAKPKEWSNVGFSAPWFSVFCLINQ